MTFDSWLYTILEEKKLSFIFSKDFLLSLYTWYCPFTAGNDFILALEDLALFALSWMIWGGQNKKTQIEISGGKLTAVLRFSASACLLLIISWLISTCWSSSLLNLMGGCFLIKLASPSSPGTVNARDFSRTLPELEEEEEEVLDWELSDRLSSVVESFPLTVPGKSWWLRVSATSVRF